MCENDFAFIDLRSGNLWVGRFGLNHGIVDVFAYQEAVLIEAVFAIAVLTMLWVGFRRWLQHKETMARLAAEQDGARIERVEARLEAVEQMVTDGGAKRPPPQIEPSRENSLQSSS